MSAKTANYYQAQKNSMQAPLYLPPYSPPLSISLSFSPPFPHHLSSSSSSPPLTPQPPSHPPRNPPHPLPKLRQLLQPPYLLCKPRHTALDLRFANRWREERLVDMQGAWMDTGSVDAVDEGLAVGGEVSFSWFLLLCDDLCCFVFVLG